MLYKEPFLKNYIFVHTCLLWGKKKVERGVWWYKKAAFFYANTLRLAVAVKDGWRRRGGSGADGCA